MAPLIIVGALLGILVPVLLASVIADLTRRKIIALIVLVAVGGSAIAIWSSDAFQRRYWHWMLPKMPAAQSDFIALAQRLRDLREHTDARTISPPLREVESELCALPVNVEDWVGRVAHVYQNASGDAASVAIQIAPHLTLSTALFAGPSGTLIKTTSPLFATVRQLQERQIVRFGGTLVGHAGACPDEPPINPNERQRDPEFLFRFRLIAPDGAG